MSKYFLPALILVFVANTAKAQPDEAAPLVKSLTIQELAKIVEEEGSRVIKIFPETNELVVKVEGYHLYLLLWDHGRVLGGRFSVKGDRSITLDSINTWNRTKAWNRAFFDRDRNPCLEFDLDLRFGVTNEGIVDHIRTFQKSVPKFASHLRAGKKALPADQPLSGTTWAGEESLEGYGELTFEFRANAIVVMTDTASTVQGKWRQDRDQVILTFGNCAYVGRIAGSTMTGSATVIKNGDPVGEPWRFSVAKRP